MHLVTRRRRTATVLTALAGVLLLPVGAAVAAGSGSIDHVESRGGQLQVLYSLPPGSSAADLGSVKVTFDGKPVAARAALASSGDQRVRRTTVLAIDTSNSMGDGGKFRQAKQAARVFLRSIPSDVRVGIVTFAGSVRVAQSPSTDRATSLAVVDRLGLSLGTHLYDGVDRAARLTGTDGQRSVLVLSDGRDTSKTSLSTTTASLRASRTKVDVVALAQAERDRTLVAQLARASGGAVIDAAEPKQLTDVFSSQARVLSRQLLVTARPAASTRAREGTVAVNVTAGGTTYADSAFVTVARTTPTASSAAAALPTPSDATVVSPQVLMGGLAGIAVACTVLVLVLGGGMGGANGDERLQQRISAYTAGGAAPRTPVTAPQGVKGQAVDIATKALAANHGLEVKLSARLEGAGTSFKPAEWLLLHTGIALGAGLVAFLLTGGNVLLTFLALLVGAVGPWTYLGTKRKRRLRAFDSQLPATLQLMAGSLQAGLSLAQGLDTIVREGADPVAGEFRRALVETRLGVQIEDALDSVAQRMGSDDFRWTVMAIRIQREVGGNLSQLMLNVAATMREREYLRRQVKALSAEGRFSAYILLAIPPLVLTYESLTNPGYLHPLVSTPIGWVLVVAMVVLMSLGAFMMSRLIKLEV